MQSTDRLLNSPGKGKQRLKERTTRFPSQTALDTMNHSLRFPCDLPVSCLPAPLGDHDGWRLYRWVENRAASLHPVADAPASTGRVSLPLDKHYGHKATREDAFVARTGGSALMILVTNKLIVYCVSFFAGICVCVRAFSFRV